MKLYAGRSFYFPGTATGDHQRDEADIGQEEPQDGTP